MNRPSKRRNVKIGKMGEQVVALWLAGQGWEILHHRWHCRWGEIDLIARCEAMLAFIEVKTRSRGNWDEGGLLAITPQKQAKLWQTAELFLTQFPELATLPCRFDLALLSYQRAQERMTNGEPPVISLGQPVLFSGYRWILHQYLESILD